MPLKCHYWCGILFCVVEKAGTELPHLGFPVNRVPAAAVSCSSEDLRAHVLKVLGLPVEWEVGIGAGPRPEWVTREPDLGLYHSSEQKPSCGMVRARLHLPSESPT